MEDEGRSSYRHLVDVTYLASVNKTFQGVENRLLD